MDTIIRETLIKAKTTLFDLIEQMSKNDDLLKYDTVKAQEVEEEIDRLLCNNAEY